MARGGLTPGEIIANERYIAAARELRPVLIAAANRSAGRSKAYVRELEELLTAVGSSMKEFAAAAARKRALKFVEAIERQAALYEQDMVRKGWTPKAGTKIPVKPLSDVPLTAEQREAEAQVTRRGGPRIRTRRAPEVRLAARAAEFERGAARTSLGISHRYWRPIFDRTDVQLEYKTSQDVADTVMRAMEPVGRQIVRSFEHTFSTWKPEHRPAVDVHFLSGAPGEVALEVLVAGPAIEGETPGGTVENLYAMLSQGARPHVIAPVREFPAHPFRGERQGERGGLVQAPGEKRLFLHQRKEAGWLSKSDPSVARAYRGALADPAKTITLERDEAVGHPGFEGRDFEDKIWNRYRARLAGAIQRATHHRVQVTGI